MKKSEVSARVKLRIWLNRITIPGHVWHYGWYHTLTEKLANGYTITGSRGPYDTRRLATIACMKEKTRLERQRVREGYRDEV